MSKQEEVLAKAAIKLKLSNSSNWKIACENFLNDLHFKGLTFFSIEGMAKRMGNLFNFPKPLATKQLLIPQKNCSNRGSLLSVFMYPEGSVVKLIVVNSPVK